MRRSRLAPVLVLAATACGGPKAQGDGAAAGPDKPAFDFPAMVARELDAMPAAQPLQGPGGTYTASVPASGPVTVEAAEGYSRASWPIGTSEPIQCFVYPERKNMAEVMTIMFNAVKNEQSKVAVERIDAGALAEQPFLALDSFYRVESPEGAMVGQLKLIGVGHDTLSILCSHDEPGYRESFKSAVAAFIGTLKIAGDETPAPLFRSLHIAEVGAQRIGFSDLYVHPAEDGKVSYYASTAILAPRKDGSVSSMDTDALEMTNKKGQLVEGKYVVVRDGQPIVALDLAQKDKKTFTLTGGRGGQEVAAEVVAKDGLTGTYGQYLLSAEKLAKGQKSWSAPILEPGGPDAPIEAKFEVTADVDDGMPVLLQTQGTTKLKMSVDKTGRPVTIWVLAPDGSVIMTFKRVVNGGTLVKS